MALDRNAVPGQRVRPARRSRWRRYTPALVAIVLGSSLFAAAEPIVELGAQLTLGSHATLTIAASLAAVATTLAAALADRPPARWFIACAFAVSVGANLTGSAWLVTPLVALGLGGVAVREVERAADGLTLGTSAVTLHRPLKDPFTVAYEDVLAVHTTIVAGEAGTLILETKHGTVTARDIPGVRDIQARIEARMTRFDLDDEEDAARRARETIQDLIRGTPNP